MLQIQNISKSYKKGLLSWKNQQQVLHDVSFECGTGECLGIIGESGSGKSTLVRLMLGIDQPDQGQVLLNGQSVQHRLTRKGKISAVFQDYTSSINPFFTVQHAIQESIPTQQNQHNDVYLDQLLEQAGLNSSYRNKYPHELSGGEAQRVCIARAVASKPQYIVLDEAISSLDVSVQVQILDLLKELKAAYGMSYIFITHDIQAAAYICDRIIIFRSGRIEEIIAVNQLNHVQSTYARKLLDASILV